MTHGSNVADFCGSGRVLAALEVAMIPVASGSETIEMKS